MTPFRVIDKDTHESFDVYDITYDKNSYPHFLVYLGNEWIRLSAKHFRPSFEDLEEQYVIDSRPSRWTTKLPDQIISKIKENTRRIVGETTKEYRCTADNWFCWEAEPLEKDKEDLTTEADQT